MTKKKQLNVSVFSMCRVFQKWVSKGNSFCYYVINQKFYTNGFYYKSINLMFDFVLTSLRLLRRKVHLTFHGIYNF